MNIPGAYEKVQTEEIQGVPQRASVSESLFRKIGATVNEALLVAETPLGSIEASVLTTSQFQSQRGLGWILCDGQNIVGSAFYVLTGSIYPTAPDLRGAFVRGHDSGGGPPRGFGDDTGAVITEFRMSQLMPHLHDTEFFTDGPAPATHGLGSDLAQQQFAGGTDAYEITPTPNFSVINYSVNPTGVGDTRPRNITVNFFLRIN